jgi:hypothetical protein
MWGKRLLVIFVATIEIFVPGPSKGADMTLVFGPQQFTRMTGAPQTFAAPFSHCGTEPCQIVVVNGNPDGSNRVSSASVFLNGVEVVGPADFNQQVGMIIKPVNLVSQNQLVVHLASKPGSFVTLKVQCLASPAVLSAVAPGTSLLDPTHLLSAFRIANTGTAPAENVQISSLTMAGATLASPATLPLNLGTIPPSGDAIVDADFSGGPFSPGATYTLAIEGTYAVGTATYCFSLSLDLILPPGAPGSAVLKTGSIEPNFVSGGGFPPQPPQPPDLSDVDISRWTVPTGPFVPAVQTPTGTAVQRAPIGDPGEVTFITNNGQGLNANTCCAEPSGASGGGVVFTTANSFAAYSTDGGATFTQLNPTTIFPNNADGGFCCDQIVQYVPSIDRFIWLMQFWRGAGGSGSNRMRIASASPADIITSHGTAWTYWDLTSGFFGLGSTKWLDYPDLSVGTNYLYMSCDEVGTGLEVARIPLTQIQASGTIFVDFTDPSLGSMAYGGHLMQNTLNEIFWAGHNDNGFCALGLPFGLSVCGLRVFSLMEGSNTYFWQDIGIGSWPNTGLSSTTPDGLDWLTKLRDFPGSALIGATRTGNQLWFGWSAGTNSAFHQPHVQMVALNIDNNEPPNISVSQQVQIWNNGYAFAYPALATNGCTGEVGLSLEYGGNGNYENHVVGLWGDFLVYITTGSNVGASRFGDYVTIRQQPATPDNPGNLFDALGYGLNSVPPPGSGTTTDLRYVAFGRPASSCAIIK